MASKQLRFEYDQEADAAYIRLQDSPVDHTVDLEQVPLGLSVLADVDSEGRLIGFELLSVRTIVGDFE